MYRASISRCVRLYSTKTPEFPPNLLNLRVGKILRCQHHENAENLYVSQIQIHEETPLQVCSGLVKFIPLEQMVDRRVVVLTNLKPSKMRGVKSEAMVLATEDESSVELINPPVTSEVGERLLFELFPVLPQEPPRLKSKVWQEIQSCLKTNSRGEATYTFQGKEYVLRGQEGQTANADTLRNTVIR